MSRYSDGRRAGRSVARHGPYLSVGWRRGCGADLSRAGPKADGGLYRAVDRGAAVLAVCAGYQIAGMSFTVGYKDEVISGLGLLDVTTTRGPVRAVGEIISWNGRDGHEQWLTGFENHGGYTRLGSGVRPLATVEIGIGNCNDGTEGAVAGTVIGTYPHGPILARNPALADHVLELALGHGCHRWSVPRSTSSGGNGLRGSVDQVRVLAVCPGCRPDSSAMEVDDCDYPKLPSSAAGTTVWSQPRT